MKEIYELSATEITTKIRNHELTARAVAESFIKRIEKINPLINALHQFDPERILKEADQADQLIREKKPVGRLHGLPVTIKDTCKVKGFKTGKGCPAFFKNPSEEDATVVARLKAEGAIILGISNAPELLISFETDNLLFGRTNNPYDLTRTPGGSSGGEAALIASGCSPAGIGSDAGGSIRQPAHYSGVCGLKPTQYSVPLSGNIPMNGAGLATQLFTMGPLARYVEDLNLLMQIISGPDNIDPHMPPMRYKDYSTVDISRLRVAYFFSNKNVVPTEETIKAVDSVVKALASQVASIQEDCPTPIENTFKLHWETFVFGGDKGHGLKQLFSQLGQKEISPLLTQFLSHAEKCEFSITELRRRLVEVEQFRYAMMRYIENYDVVISPAAATPARKHGETHDHVRDFTYLMVHNLTGWPAVVVPVSRSKEGLPIGIQIVAKPWHDHVCLALAKKIQEIYGVFPVVDVKPSLEETSKDEQRYSSQL